MMILLLLIANILLVSLTKWETKYFLIPVSLFLFLIIVFAGWRTVTNARYKAVEEKYQEATDAGGSNHRQWQELASTRSKNRETNEVFINLLLLQSFLTFMLQIFGRKRSNAGIYKTTIWIFGILFIAFLWIRVMMSVVPSTGFVK